MNTDLRARKRQILIQSIHQILATTNPSLHVSFTWHGLVTIRWKFQQATIEGALVSLEEAMLMGVSELL